MKCSEGVMGRAGVWTRAIATTAFVMGASLTPALGEPAPGNAAHTIAQKFAEQASEQKSAAPTQTVVRPPLAAAVAAAPKSPERPSLDYEMDMLRQARAEAAERKVSEKPAKVLQAVAPITLPLKPTPAAAPSGPVEGIIPAATVPEAAVLAPQPALSKLADVKPAPAPLANPPNPTERVTILLVMDSDAAGLDRLKASHDLLVCIGETCHVSSGFETAAKALGHVEAFALKSSEGVTPDTCRAKTACIYRDVAVSATPRITLLDLGADRSAAKPGDGYTADIDKSCRVADGELVCDHGLATSDFRLWVVPEATAKLAGSKVLEEALVDGLGGMSVTGSNDK